MKGKSKTTLVWIALVVGCLVLFSLSRRHNSTRVETFENFREHVRAGRVGAVKVRGKEITVYHFPPESEYLTEGVIDGGLLTLLAENEVSVHWDEERGSGAMPWVFLAVIGVVVFFFLLRRAKGTQMDLLSLGKSPARQVGEDHKVTFQDVGGCTEAKQMLGDVVEFLKNPRRWTQAGARLPRGVLLEGPPGCGKTLLARAVAGETNAHFLMIAASEFVQMFVGVGAARVRDLFETAAKKTPAIVFIDELDAVGRRRGSGVGTGHDEREQTLNQILVCLDGFANHQAIVVLAATNRPDILDQALLRPGRFDRRIRVTALQRDDRLEILRIHTKTKPLGDDVSLDRLADETEGYNGAELENLANEAALLAVRRACQENGDAAQLRMDDFYRVLRATTAGNHTFNKLDAVLIESNTQLAEPTGKAVVRVTMVDGTSTEGEIIWADASFLKIRTTNGQAESLLAKSRIHQLQSLAGTEAARRDDVSPDVWAHDMPGMA